MRIAVLYNHPEHLRRAGSHELVADQEVRRTATELCEVLSPPHQVLMLRVSRELLGRLRPGLFDLVFNLAEGVEDWEGTEPLVAAALELARLPFTGAPSLALALGQDKTKTRALLAAAGLRTPAGQLLLHPETSIDPGLRFPMIVKPVGLHASIGVDTGSVVTDLTQLRARAARLRDVYGQAAVIEEYVEGREINCALLGNDPSAVLPLSEIMFQDGTDGVRVVTFDSKWSPRSADAVSQPVRCPAELTAEQEREIREAALAAFHVTGCRDYARVDFRLGRTEGGGETAYIIDVNPNPAIDRRSGFARSAERAGMSYPRLIQTIVDVAGRRTPQRRGRRQTPAAESARLRARPVEPSDLPTLVRWFNDPEVSRYMEDPQERTDAEQLGEAIFVRSADLDLMIMEKSSGTPVGYGSAYGMDNERRSAEISFLIGDPAYRGLGLGTELATLVVRAAFDLPELARLKASIVTENQASLRVCRDLGFKDVGYLRGSHTVDGRVCDEILLELTREEAEFRLSVPPQRPRRTGRTAALTDL